METRAPSRARVMVMVLFALSCFGLFIYLWEAFGGSVPLQPRGYRVEVAFPEATSLSVEADVRVSGVRVGKVRDTRLDKTTSRTLVDLELDRRFTPLASDARAILRQKTLLGETFVELTPGTRSAPRIPDGGRLADGQVQEAVQLDEILDSLDAPTRAAFRSWQQAFGRAVDGRGRELNEAFGQLPDAVSSGDDLLAVLDSQARSVHGLVRDTGSVFAALADHGRSLRSLSRSGAAVLGAAAEQEDALARSVRALPAFLRETRTTLQRTERFARVADPVVSDLTPAMEKLAPALRAAGGASPSFSSLAGRLDPFIDAAKSGLPAASEVLGRIGPMFDALAPFLGRLNPILEWLEYNQRYTMAFFDSPTGLADTTATADPKQIGHYLRALSPAGLETISLWPERLSTERGNAYLNPQAIVDQRRYSNMILPSWDCENTGKGEFTTQKGGTRDAPSCWRMGFPGLIDKPGVFPHIGPEDYLVPGGVRFAGIPESQRTAR